MKSRLKAAAVALGAVLLLLILAEISLRLWWPPSFGGYYIYPPNIHSLFHPVQDAIYGVSEDTDYWTNSDGLRGDAYDPDPAIYHILSLGGSTTECRFLDQAGTWPEKVRTKLAEEMGRSVWVGNGGHSGQRSWESLAAMLYIVPGLHDVDMVIVMPGANDLSTLLRTGVTSQIRADYTQHSAPTEVMDQTFVDWPKPLARESLLFRLIAAPHRPSDGRQVTPYEEVSGEQDKVQRERRFGADVFIDELPDLTEPLAIYRSNLEQIVDAAEQQGVTLVFVTQAAIYTDDMPRNIQRRLWLGGATAQQDALAYYTPGALRQAYDQYNSVLLDVCRERQILCVDAASAINAKFNYFYDDVHMNYDGTDALSGVIVKEIMAGHLIK